MSSRVVAQKPDTSLLGAIFLFVFATGGQQLNANYCFDMLAHVR